MINIDGLKDLNYPQTLKEYLGDYTVKPGNQTAVAPIFLTINFKRTTVFIEFLSEHKKYMITKVII